MNLTWKLSSLVSSSGSIWAKRFFFTYQTFARNFNDICNLKLFTWWNSGVWKIVNCDRWKKRIRLADWGPPSLFLLALWSQTPKDLTGRKTTWLTEKTWRMDKQTDRLLTAKKHDGRTNRHTNRWTNRQTNRRINRQTNWQTDWQSNVLLTL